MSLLLLLAGADGGAAVTAPSISFPVDRGLAYEIWLATDTGRRVKYLGDDVTRFEYVLRVNDWDYVSVELATLLDPDLLRPDRQLQIFRQPPGGTMALDAVGLLRYWHFERSGDGDLTYMAGPGPTELLSRRIVAYAAGTAQAGINGEADDGIKDIVSENLGSGAAAARDLSSYVTIAGDATAGPSMEKQFAWRRVLDVLREINTSTRADGTEVFFGVEANGFDSAGDLLLNFATYTGQPGNDLTIASGSSFLFSLALGNLDNARLMHDYSQEENYIYAAGRGVEGDRVTQETSDADRIAASVFGRREGFRDARHMDSTAGVLDEANSQLEAKRPIVRLTADLLDTEQARYQSDWGLGDKVTAQAFSQSFDGIIRQVRVRVIGGAETIAAGFESEAT